MIRILKKDEVPAAEIFARSTPTVNVSGAVAEILRNVRERGDAAVLDYTERFDGVKLESLTVSPEEMAEGVAKVEPAFLRVLERAAATTETSFSFASSAAKSPSPVKTS